MSGMVGPAVRPAKRQVHNTHPFAGMIRIRFEGSPRCKCQRFLSPLPGSPWWPNLYSKGR
ncbi:hypothetical protein D3C81_534260 [compost metagenome]|jgi:hypothetical protein